MEVDDAKNYGSYGSQVRFQILLQAANIIVFFVLGYFLSGNSNTKLVIIWLVNFGYANKIVLALCSLV